MKRKTIIIIEVSNSEYTISSNCIDFKRTQTPETKEARKYEERLMRMMVADRRIFDFFLRIVEPVKRYYKREDRKVNDGLMNDGMMD